MQPYSSFSGSDQETEARTKAKLKRRNFGPIIRRNKLASHRFFAEKNEVQLFEELHGDKMMFFTQWQRRYSMYKVRPDFKAQMDEMFPRGVTFRHGCRNITAKFENAGDCLFFIMKFL
jgi:hypothetical protein